MSTSSLTQKDIQEILKVIDDTPYNELELETADFKLVISRDADSILKDSKQGWRAVNLPKRESVSNPLQTPSAVISDSVVSDNPEEQSSTEAISSEKQTNSTASNSSASAQAKLEGLLEIKSPMVGTWYMSPKPGAEPFIQKGSKLSRDTIIGIIEVMKLMSSIPAGLTGTVVEILVEDAQFVEKGQSLLLVKP
jgi:acetyl-CoA carboxylase biotin carboxyl carrier protein